MTIRIAVAIATIAVTLLCGCGQTGPLYLPGKPGEVPPLQAPGETGERDEEDDDG